MNHLDPLRPASIDDIIGPPAPGPSCGDDGRTSAYRPYQWDMPWIDTPQPVGQHFQPPPPEPPSLPRYEDAIPYDLISRALRDGGG